MEDKKTEMSYRRTHTSTAWAIRAVTSTSFFNRASLIWLKQVQQRIPTADARVHQDLQKLIAALEYSADATLTAATFASRALVSTVTSRRLLWLRSWRADVRSKWRLASAHYKGSLLFGAALDPVLVEGRNKKMVLPYSSSSSSSFPSPRRAERRYTPYLSRQPFRTDSGPGGSF